MISYVSTFYLLQLQLLGYIIIIANYIKISLSYLTIVTKHIKELLLLTAEVKNQKII